MHAPTKVVNVYESSTPSSISISKEFQLDRIDLQVHRLKAGEVYKNDHLKGTTTVVYVLKEDAALSVAEVEGTSQVNKDHLFIFTPKDAQVSYELKAGANGATIFVARDIGTEKAEYLDVKSQPTLPKILDAYGLTKFGGKGMNCGNMAYLTRQVDPREEGVDTGSRWWNFNIERMPPGTQASWAHCHSAEDELVLIIDGSGRYYHHGEEPEHIFKPGDVVGWKAGTGLMHTLLNDGREDGSGDELVFLCWGECLEREDKCDYVSRDPETFKHYAWTGYPKHPVGKAYDLPRFPRKDPETTEKEAPPKCPWSLRDC